MSVDVTACLCVCALSCAIKAQVITTPPLMAQIGDALPIPQWDGRPLAPQWEASEQTFLPVDGTIWSWAAKAVPVAGKYYLDPGTYTPLVAVASSPPVALPIPGGVLGWDRTFVDLERAVISAPQLMGTTIMRNPIGGVEHTDLFITWLPPNRPALLGQVFVCQAYRFETSGVVASSGVLVRY